MWDEWTDDPVEWFVRVAVVLFVVFCVWLVASVTLAGVLDGQCMRLGYRSSNLTLGWSRYCITRTDQTDIVVPLDSARALHRR